MHLYIRLLHLALGLLPVHLGEPHLWLGRRSEDQAVWEMFEIRGDVPSMAEIEKAAEAASAKDFIQQLDEKYDSMIGVMPSFMIIIQ